MDWSAPRPAHTRSALAIESVPGTDAGQRILRFTGKVTSDTVPEFLRVVRAEQAPAVVLDFSGVPYIDSSGVGALVQTYSSFRKEQRRLALAGINPRVYDVLELTRLHRLFDILPAKPTL